MSELDKISQRIVDLAEEYMELNTTAFGASFKLDKIIVLDKRLSKLNIDIARRRLVNQQPDLITEYEAYLQNKSILSSLLQIPRQWTLRFSCLQGFLEE